MNENTNVYVLHHANCFDGTGARYAAWKRFGDEAQYIPVQYGQPFPPEVKLNKDSEVYILDFSYDRETLERVNEQVGFLLVLDHHKTAKEALEGLEYAEFDMDRSGAVMAWQYFHPNVEVPRLLRHVQDGDLWKFKMMHTEAVRSALPLLENDLHQWDNVATTELAFEALVSAGKTILKANQIKVDSVIRNNVKVLPYKGYKAGVYNTTVLVSEIGNAVYDDKNLDCDISMSYFFDKDGQPIVSFRSRNPDGPDVGALAKELGGGGHPHASGSKVTWQFLQDLYAGKL